MRISTQLLMVTVGITILSMTVFGVIATRIMLDSARVQQKTHLIDVTNDIFLNSPDAPSEHLLKSYLDKIKNELHREKITLMAMNDNLIFYISDNELMNSLSTPDLNNIDFSETEDIKLIMISDVAYLYTTESLPDTAYKLLFLEPEIDINHPLSITLIKRLLTSGIIIIWVAIWIALVFGSIIAKHLKAKNIALKHQAMHDTLTNLPNRMLLMDRLKQAQLNAHRQLSPFVLIILDLDSFKEINDTMGHQYGDELLVKISNRLLDSLRENDSLARLGGDEFAILLPNTDYKGAEICAKKVLTTLEQPLQINETLIEVKASLGITLYPEHGDSTDMIMQHADVAMYQAKQIGGGSYAFYDPSQDSNSVRRLQLMTGLRHAIENNLINVHYQPMVDQSSNRTVAVEVLARWHDKELGFIPPDEFIPIAEQTGTIRPLTLWVLNQATLDASHWKSLGYNIKIAVNISTNCLQDTSFPEKINKIISKNNILASEIELEITESALMSDLSRARQMLDQLHEIGFQISIDDFGTGFSSLAYLKQLPVDVLKIDKSFIDDMKDNQGDAAIVSTIIQLAHSLNCKVVAEGIEDAETYDLLKELNNDIAQGYLMSRPLPASDLEQWMETSPWKPKQNIIKTGKLA